MLSENIGRIQSPKIIRIGAGVAKEIVDVLKQLNLSKPLIVTDKNLLDLGHVDLVLAILENQNISWTVFDAVVEDPTDQCVDAGLEVFNRGSFDCIIGLGGGSPMDTAKAISFMSVNDGHIRDYKAPNQVDLCGPPVIFNTNHWRYRFRADQMVRYYRYKKY